MFGILQFQSFTLYACLIWLFQIWWFSFNSQNKQNLSFSKTSCCMVWPQTLIFRIILLLSLTLNGWWMNSSSSLFSWTISSSDDDELSILFLDLEEILLQKSTYIKKRKKKYETKIMHHSSFGRISVNTHVIWNH